MSKFTVGEQHRTPHIETYEILMDGKFLYEVRGSRVVAEGACQVLNAEWAQVQNKIALAISFLKNES